MPLSVLSGGILCFAHPAASSRRAGDFPPRRGPGLIPHLLVHVGQKLWPSGTVARRAPEGREVRRTIGIRPCPPLPYFLSLSSEARPAGFSGASLPPYVSLCIAPAVSFGALPCRAASFPLGLPRPCWAEGLLSKFVSSHVIREWRRRHADRILVGPWAIASVSRPVFSEFRKAGRRCAFLRSQPPS